MFGDTLRDRRKLLGISQNELAARAGISLRTIRNLENGIVRRPHFESVKRLSRAVGLTLPTTARINLLGPLELVGPGGLLDVGQGKVRCLLGVLALQPGHRVQVSEIIRSLWEDDPPETHLNLVDTYVTRLRRELASISTEQDGIAIVSLRSGYQLVPNRAELDTTRWADLIGQGDRLTHVHPARAATAFSAALDLWRGAALSDLPATIREHPAAVSLNSQRTTVAVKYADLARTLPALHADAAARIHALALQNPYHEGLHASTMRTLSAGGQRAAALQLYEKVRRRLSDELGVRPGQDLQAALRDVLHD